MVKLPFSIIVLQMRDERMRERKRKRRWQGGSEEERSQPPGRTILMSLPLFFFLLCRQRAKISEQFGLGDFGDAPKATGFSLFLVKVSVCNADI